MTSQLKARPATTGECKPHTPAPAGYLAWHEWAEKKSRTHQQGRCPGCGLFLIWQPKENPNA